MAIFEDWILHETFHLATFMGLKMERITYFN